MEDCYEMSLSLQAWKCLAAIEREVNDERHRAVVESLKAYARSF
ncbi:hypothetical protein [Porphyromonas circumdentaria]|nr:hypothetical protein [Porphyromonas circumdentaria]MBB6276236.1 hypothetical protein [Porphyromonas circumdentaria]MDO4722291.1 hypothetical protein [Porphyromonas circumdentaria]